MLVGELHYAEQHLHERLSGRIHVHDLRSILGSISRSAGGEQRREQCHCCCCRECMPATSAAVTV